MRTSSISCVVFLLFFSNAIASEAVTYSGKIGNISVIVELAKGKSGRFEAGRYAYMNKGTDIPLHVNAASNGVFTISEEKPCTEALCKGADDKVADDAPVGATWTLKAEGNGLSGRWADKESARSLPVRLQQVGKRTIQDDGDILEALAPDAAYSGRPEPLVLKSADLPYDFLKIAGPLKPGAVKSIGAFSYRMEKDARLGDLEYPTVLAFGGQNPARVNAYLAQQRLQFELSSFSCLSRAYLGLGWSGMGGEGSNGFDGGSQVEVNLLNSRLIGLTESGSFDCGGAHPDNFSNFRLADARTGEALIPERLLRGWVAKDGDGNAVDPTKSPPGTHLDWGPSNELIDYVKKNREKTDDDSERDCGYDDLIGQYLGVYFTEDSLVFTLQGLPHVIFACGYDMVTVPLKDARPLLTEKGASYFEVLDR
jgi:hypothetical protein